MQKTFQTDMTKTYGNGFDAVTHKADIRAFLDWWNEKSFFPLSDADAKQAGASDYPMAA